jgi:hypothetical protein
MYPAGFPWSRGESLKILILLDTRKLNDYLAME